MYLDDIKTRFGTLNIISSNNIKPCTPEEIATLERQLGVILPEAYREFLLWMGHDTGELYVGSHWHYSNLPNLQEVALELLEYNAFPETLPNDAFVFWMHQGYQFLFFRTSEGEDPPVYYYNEGLHETSFAKHSDSFSEFLTKLIKSYATKE